MQMLKYSKEVKLQDFYVYGYLREVDDEHGAAGTLRYIGKGQGGRVKGKHRVRVPKNRDYIVIFEQGVLEEVAYTIEQELITEYGRIDIKTGILENKDNGGSWGRLGRNDGMVTVRNGKGETFRTTVHDEKYRTGELNHVAKNMTPAKDLDGNYHYVSVTDLRFKTGKLTGIKKGMITVKDKNGNKFNVEATDNRLVTGELVGVAKGIKHSTESVKIRSDKVRGTPKPASYVSCRACKKTCAKGLYVRWHNKCRIS
jgi:hypothetical protein